MLPSKDPQRVRRISLAVLAVAISTIFLWMIWPFVTALLFAAILSGMFHPLYKWLAVRFGGRRRLASVTTIALVLLGVIVPLTGFLGIVANQTLRLSRIAKPWVEQNFGRAPELERLFDSVPMLATLKPYREQILTKLGEFAGTVGSHAVDLVTIAARETVTFFLLLFIALYAMYFFLISGRRTLSQVLYYLPLPPEDEARMVDKFVSVARATIKGTLIIGVIQGSLGGMAFWVAGLDGAALWGTVMAVLSTIPGLGHALVWVPAVIYLAASGDLGSSFGLFIWCAGVVGSIDNFLRPWLVGRDVSLPDLLILVSTLGGLLAFGPLGFIIGPIVASLCVTVWDLYGSAFKDLLPPAPEAPPSIPIRARRPTPDPVTAVEHDPSSNG